jgi:putative SOS response-associated peptidase YedK
VEAAHICNLYRMTKGVAEVARLYGAPVPALWSNAPVETYPGYPGLVVRKADGACVVVSMTWGCLLRLKTMAPTAKPNPVNNVAELRKGMWIGLARKPQWRCLIPFTHFAEAEGPKGGKTRTWFNVKNQAIAA